MAPLTELGIKQAEEVSWNPFLENCQIIVSLPYTRALQTAAIISKNTGLDIKVEVDIHEFIPDKTFQVKGEEENKILHKDFMRCLGEYPEGEVRKWETITEIINRSRQVFILLNDFTCHEARLHNADGFNRMITLGNIQHECSSSLLCSICHFFLLHHNVKSSSPELLILIDK